MIPTFEVLEPATSVQFVKPHSPTGIGEHTNIQARELDVATIQGIVLRDDGGEVLARFGGHDSGGSEE